MDGDGTLPVVQPPVRAARVHPRLVQVGILDHAGLPSGRRNDAQLLPGIRLFHDLGRDERPRTTVEPEEYRIGHPDERIVHLEVEQVLHALLAHRGKGPGLPQRFDHTAVAVRVEEQAAVRRHEQAAVE